MHRELKKREIKKYYLFFFLTKKQLYKSQRLHLDPGAIPSAYIRKTVLIYYKRSRALSNGNPILLFWLLCKHLWSLFIKCSTIAEPDCINKRLFTLPSMDLSGYELIIPRPQPLEITIAKNLKLFEDNLKLFGIWTLINLKLLTGSEIT